MESIVSIIVDNTLVAASSVTILLLILGLIWLKSGSAKSLDSSDDNILNDEMQRRPKKGSKTRQKKVKPDKAKPSTPNGHVMEQHVVGKTTAAEVPKISDRYQGGTTETETAKPSKSTKEIKKQTKETSKLDSSGEWTTVAATRKKPKAKEGSHQTDATCSEELHTKDECSKTAEPNESALGARFQPVEKDEVPCLPVKYSEADEVKVQRGSEQGSLSVDPLVNSFIEAHHVDGKQLETAAGDSNDEETTNVEEQAKKKKKKKKSKSSPATVEIGVISGKVVNTTFDSNKPVAEVKRDEVNASLTQTVELVSSVVQETAKADAVPSNAVSETPMLPNAPVCEEFSSDIVPAKTTIVFDELGDDTAATMTSVNNKKKKKPRREN